MDCRNCGKELPQNSSFCKACGARWLPEVDRPPAEKPRKKPSKKEK